MSKVWILISMSIVLIGAVHPLQADAPISQKESTKAILDKYQRTQASRDVSKELCDRVMSNPKAKALICEMLLNDPEGRKLLKLK